MIVWLNMSYSKLSRDLYNLLGKDIIFFESGEKIQAIPDIELVEVFLYHLESNNLFDWDYIQQFKNSSPSIPIIVTSSQLRSQNILLGLRAKVWDYIVLPQEEDYLFTLIEDIRESRSGDGYSLKSVNLPDNNAISKIKLKGMSIQTLPAIKYISSRVGYQVIRVEELAEVCNMNPATFSRCFKKDHGVGVREYIKRLRISIACELLKRDKLLIKKIAEYVGYEDVSYFVKQFREVSGYTPVAYRYRWKKLPQ